jgi:hypothetical protein
VDSAVPIQGDLRAHIFKIDIFHSFLARGVWPGWIPYWYQGFPVNQFYPPGFYLLGAVLTAAVGQAVVAYKLLMVAALVSNGIATYYFARRFLRFDWLPSLICLIAYEACTPLLVNYMYGEGPNLLSWNMCLFFFAAYLGNVSEAKIKGIRSTALPALLLGLTALIHPFPAIFAGMAVVLFYILWLLRNRNRRPTIKSHLLYFLMVFGIGGLISAYYWLPALLTFQYASPMYLSTQQFWPSGTEFIALISVLALSVALVIRRRLNDRLKLDFTLACFVLATMLGFGATRLMPFGLGSLMHEFRFATIMAPFFGILLIGYLLNSPPEHVDYSKFALALLGGIGLALVIFVVQFYPIFLSLITSKNGVGISYSNLIILLRSDFTKLALLVIPMTILLLIAISTYRQKANWKISKSRIAISAGASLILLVCVLPSNSFTWSRNSLGGLFSYTNNYQTPEYAQIMGAVTDGRLIVSGQSGYLTEGDSPVTFGWRWGVETVTGPYNQGDPKFFLYTVHVEWENRWLDYSTTRLNLMQEGAARYVFIRDKRPTLTDSSGLTTIVNNSYGQLLKLDQQVSRAVSVTPVLLDVHNPKEVTEFFNILLPEGYKFVFVDSSNVPDDLRSKFDLVMVDDVSEVSKYYGKSVFLLEDESDMQNVSVLENNGYVKISLPLHAITNQLFYNGSEGNARGWAYFESAMKPQLVTDCQATTQQVNEKMQPYLDRLFYRPASYECKSSAKMRQF